MVSSVSPLVKESTCVYTPCKGLRLGRGRRRRRRRPHPSRSVHLAGVRSVTSGGRGRSVEVAPQPRPAGGAAAPPRGHATSKRSGCAHSQVTKHPCPAWLRDPEPDAVESAEPRPASIRPHFSCTPLFSVELLGPPGARSSLRCASLAGMGL